MKHIYAYNEDFYLVQSYQGNTYEIKKVDYSNAYSDTPITIICSIIS